MFKTLAVVDPNSPLLQVNQDCFISFEQYLREYPKRNELRTRVVNLCDVERYLGRGYYCSLLAEAREHPVIPSVRTINAVLGASSNEDDWQLAPSAEWSEFAKRYSEPLLFYFGQTNKPELTQLASKLFAQYPLPIMRLEWVHSDSGSWPKISPLSPSALTESQSQELLAALDIFIKPQWRLQTVRKQFRWDMAVLVNPEEPNPPSNKVALNRFIKAAAKQGMRAELVTAHELQNLAYYDALFIRETTAIDHHTYRLAARAEREGVVVIDDPVSILRCCNKVFLHDAFSYQNVPSPKTQLVDGLDDAWIDRLEQSFEYPMVLKLPESAFSKGVYKVKTQQELRERLNELLDESALVLVQEYLYTEFDWRIGVLNNRAIYACKYEMARGHWQIYNHAAKRGVEGGSQTLPTFEVPRVVLDTALKAARIIGNGLYGVDLKEKDGKAYVIEVNDNPSIDHKVEDAYLGNELYMQIIEEFRRRLEARGR